MTQKRFLLLLPSVVLGVFAVVSVVSATTSTIGQNITTTGTLTVTGAVNASSTLATSGNITVPQAYALDTAGGGALNIGTTTATSITIGSSGITTTIRGTSALTTLTVSGVSTLTGAVNASSTLATSGNITVPQAYALDTAGGGALNIGTTTATSVIIGSSNAKVGIASSSPYVALGVTGTTTSSAGVVVGSAGTPTNQILFGTCIVALPAVAATTTQVGTCTANGVNIQDNVFLTSASTTVGATNNGVLIFTSASSTALNTIKVAVYNPNINGAGQVGASNMLFSWIAIH